MSVHSQSSSLITRMAGVLTLIGLAVHGVAAQETTTSPKDIQFFEQEVRPILESRCWKCHGPDKHRGGLRLDHRTFVLQGGDLGPAASTDAPDDSSLLRAINYEDLEMPPDGRLAAEQIATLTEWIQRGLPWTPGAPPEDRSPTDESTESKTTEWWAYQPITRPPVPTVKNSTWSTHAIDRFILARLEQRPLQPNPQAPRPTLIRRLYFDLLGLPPRLDDVNRFANDPHPLAYETLVDDLLSRPQFGEKWGRHWLDLVRFAETNGYERDGPKANAWRYRDYVIDAFNSDKAYDRFVLEQLAGDELADAKADSLVATGYYRLGIWDDEPADADQAYYDSLDDVVSTTSLVFMSTTIGCARCHDHKIDPIPQRDYYRMLAFFHNIYNDIQQSAYKRSPFTLNTQTVLANGTTATDYEQQRQTHRARLKELRQQIDDIERDVFETLSEPEKEDARDRNVRQHLIQTRLASVLSAETVTKYHALVEEREGLRKKTLPEPDKALTIKENGREAPETFVLIRGSAHAPGDSVTPGFPVALTDEEPVIQELPSGIPSSGRRLAFAQWLVDPQNPIVARVIVNRVWQHHFGRGLVRTASDFGQFGVQPTHPELLDYLASELIRHDWQLKWLHRLILTSQTYQLSSADDASGLGIDPENDLFWRYNMRRLGAEEIRDTVLAVTGQLNLTMHGPSVFPKMPDEVLQSASRPDAAWGHSKPADQVRRSVYAFVKRSIDDPVLLSFDAADKDASCPVRFATTVPTQALTTLNGEFFNHQASLLAERLKQETDDPADQVKRALSLVLSREPQSTEIARGLELLKRWTRDDNISEDEALRYYCLLALNLNETIYVD